MHSVIPDFPLPFSLLRVPEFLPVSAHHPSFHPPVSWALLTAVLFTRSLLAPQRQRRSSCVAHIAGVLGSGTLCHLRRYPQHSVEPHTGFCKNHRGEGTGRTEGSTRARVRLSSHRLQPRLSQQPSPHFSPRSSSHPVPASTFPSGQNASTVPGAGTGTPSPGARPSDPGAPSGVWRLASAPQRWSSSTNLLPPFREPTGGAFWGKRCFFFFFNFSFTCLSFLSYNQILSEKNGRQTTSTRPLTPCFLSRGQGARLEGTRDLPSAGTHAVCTHAHAHSTRMRCRWFCEVWGCGNGLVCVCAKEEQKKNGH